MVKRTQIFLEDLEFALTWVSADGFLEARAFIDRSTGEVHLHSNDGDFGEALPADIEDDTRYIAMPDKKELGLGRELVFEFVSHHGAPIADEVREAFRHKGAYARFRSILERSGLVDRWYAFESAATKAGLLRWAKEHGFDVQRNEVA